MDPVLGSFNPSTNKDRRRSSSPQRRTKSKKAPVEVVPSHQRVFLYLRITDVANLPTSKHKLELHVTHKCQSVTKLFAGSNIIDLSHPHDIPAFSLTIEQDSNDQTMWFCEHPLCLTLFEHIFPEGSDESDTLSMVHFASPSSKTNERLEPIAKSYLDVFRCFSKRRAQYTKRTYLYSIDKHGRGSVLTPTLTWEIYSILPLLKELSFNNVVFITLESIYNASSEILAAGYQDLIVEISFESTVPNQFMEFDKIPICSFAQMEYSVIGKQNRFLKWETLKDEHFSKEWSLGVSTGCALPMEDLFRNLLGTEGVHFDYEDIDMDYDKALVCNSQHRFTLTEPIRALLEDVLAFNQQHMLVEVYHRNNPDDKLLCGVIDLSILLYPEVNACRFAVELLPSASTILNGIMSTSFLSDVTNNYDDDPDYPTSAIISICLQIPITVSSSPLAIQDPSFFSYLNCPCTSISERDVMTPQELCNEAYRAFDAIISGLIDYIIHNQHKPINFHNKFYCCAFRNMISKIIDLIACDFNKRFPTKTNREFIDLMTIVHRELEQRIYTTVQLLTRGTLAKTASALHDVMDQIIEIMNIMKHMQEVHKEPIVDVLFDKVKEQYAGHPVLNFYQFVFALETLDFTAAKRYLESDYREQFAPAGYFADFMAIYIKYIERLQNEETFKDATEYLLIDLHRFRVKYPHDLEVCILLHCLYTRSGYKPGMEFTRWKYEKLYETKLRYLPNMPISRWEIYFSHLSSTGSKRSKAFSRTIRQFVSLGMYKFAEIVFASFGKKISDVEQYLVSTTLKILQGDVEPGYKAESFDLRDVNNSEALQIYLALVNGNLEYLKGNHKEAMKYYEFFVGSHLRRPEIFQLSLLRYGYGKMAEGGYIDAVVAFRKCKNNPANSIVANFMLGRAMYRLNRLNDAEYYFSETTTYGNHIPDAWAWLALVNLKMNANCKALECWKYAKLNMRHQIDHEVLDELAKIPYESVDLYVDLFY